MRHHLMAPESSAMELARFRLVLQKPYGPMCRTEKAGRHAFKFGMEVRKACLQSIPDWLDL